MKGRVKYYAGSFIWGAGAKLLDAGIKFLTIPLLLGYFGKDNYGLLTLAIATNAYMQLLDMGMNTGGIKFFSQWISAGKYELIDKVARTNITFYLIIGGINALVLIGIAIWGAELFNVTTDEFVTFRYLLYILSAFSVVNWVTFVFNQLLIADEKIMFTQQILVVKSVLGLLVVGLTFVLRWSIAQYFFYYLLTNVVVIVPYYFCCHRRGLIKSVLPAFYWKDFSIVFKYGLAILIMGFFQFTATHSRPLILGIFGADGVGMLSEYRIIEIFPVFIISVAGVLMNIFLPKTSKAIQNNDRAAIESLAYKGTRYTSILMALLCFPIILHSQDILTLYVGTSYSNLAPWLTIWMVTLTLYLHNSPIASLVLATGKTKMLVYSAAIACLVSIIINASLANVYGVGSAVIGYLVYIIIQMSFYYFYFNSRILGLNSLKVFKSFIIPTGLAFLAMTVVIFIPFHADFLILGIIFNTAVWILIYVVLLELCKVISFRSILVKIINK